MNVFLIIILGVLVWGAVCVVVAAAVAFATGGDYPAPRKTERVSCSNF